MSHAVSSAQNGALPLAWSVALPRIRVFGFPLHHYCPSRRRGKHPRRLELLHSIHRCEEFQCHPRHRVFLGERFGHPKLSGSTCAFCPPGRVSYYPLVLDHRWKIGEEKKAVMRPKLIVMNALPFPCHSHIRCCVPLAPRSRLYQDVSYASRRVSVAAVETAERTLHPHREG